MDEDLQDFIVHMKHKLLVHKNKGGYERLTLEELFKLLQGEMKELRVDIDSKNMTGIINECADVANYAMMIAIKIQNRSLV
jgi:NTP pyrophosphatase (non-canonical NTP hydrolase)